MTHLSQISQKVWLSRMDQCDPQIFFFSPFPFRFYPTAFTLRCLLHSQEKSIVFDNTDPQTNQDIYVALGAGSVAQQVRYYL